MDHFILVQKVDKENKTITGSDRSGQDFTFYLYEPWEVFIEYINTLDLLFVSSKYGIIDHKGKLILNPNFQVATTSIADSLSCVRKVYVSSSGASDVIPPNMQKRMMEGNCLHQLFSYKIVNDELSHEDRVTLTMDKYQPEFVSLHLDEDEMQTYLDENGRVFDRLLQLEGITEQDCQSWKLGINGKFDGLIRSNIIELKSSKIPHSNPYDTHNTQITIYQAMMEDRGDYNGLIYYVSDRKLVPKKPYTIPTSSWIVARNWAYLVLSNQVVPDIKQGQETSACKYCFVKDGCASLCAGLRDDPPCEGCVHQTSCLKKRWEDTHRTYFRNFSDALYEEELEEILSQGMMANVGKSDTYADKLVQRGYALATTKKLNEEFNNGDFEISYSFDSPLNRFRRGDLVQVYDIEDRHDLVTLNFLAIIKSIEANVIQLISSNILPNHIIIVASGTTANYRSGRKSVYQLIDAVSRIPSKLSSSIINPKMITSPLSNTINLTRLLKPNYNVMQLEAIRHAISTDDIYLIQGPAGTGKTSVIVEIVNQLFNRGKKILVSAYTNMAVDNVGMGLKEADIPFIRMGRKQSVFDELHPYLIENRHEEYISAIENELPIIILSTTSTIGKDQYSFLSFDYSLLDEAAQMTEPETLKAVLRAQRVILVGDHQQLQPIVKSSKAKINNLQKSMFERLASVDSIQNHRFTLLQYQYRMHDEILKFPNQSFYDGKLQSANEEVATQSIGEIQSKLLTNHPYEVICLQDTNFSSVMQMNGAEVSIIVAIVHDLLKSDIAITSDRIGIIAPFRAQVATLRSLLPGFTIDTVDRYQGSEKDIILFSTITTTNVPILSDPRRLNVALTRAKKKLVVVVTNPIEDGNSLINSLYRDAKSRDLLTTLDQDQIDLYTSNVRETAATIATTIHKEFDSSIPFNPYYDLRKIIGESAGIFYDTILLMETEVNDDEICPICYQDVDHGVQCLGCSYWFHKVHLETWLVKDTSCPVCKHSLIIVTY
ncbi:MAG: AAA family ATPase [Candidatus Heimdallarchaeota archaeon]|nr:AAA family ATPase [Candidatus Heimdallarchaeota archaeon]